MRLPEPKVRSTPKPYHPFHWHIDRCEQLPLPRSLEFAAERRSHREFSCPSLHSLSTLLWHVARRQESLLSPEGFDLHLRPVPSAGAIHPVHVLIEHPIDRTWTRYNPLSHTLDHLTASSAFPSIRDVAKIYVDPGAGALIAFVAEPGLTDAKYEDSASLVWRDAGVLQGAFALLAPQANLVSCLLGLSGNCFASDLGKQGQLIGTGMAILGSTR